MPQSQSEANKIALAAARLRLKQRCATDPSYRQKFVEASQKGKAVLTRMRAEGKLETTPAQLAALTQGRTRMWKDEHFIERRKQISSATMKRTNARRLAGEFPEWAKNQRRAMSEMSNKLWKRASHRRKMSKVMSETVKKVWNTPGYRELQSERIGSMHRKLWADPEYRKKMQSRPLPPGLVTQRIPFTDRKQRSLVLKSKWEQTFAVWLDSQSVDWDYEPIVIDLQNGHRYFPDFWVEQWKCYVEVKGRDWGLDKVHRAIELGWRIELLHSVSATALRQLAEKIVHSGAPWK